MEEEIKYETFWVEMGIPRKRRVFIEKLFVAKSLRSLSACRGRCVIARLWQLHLRGESKQKRMIKTDQIKVKPSKIEIWIWNRTIISQRKHENCHEKMKKLNQICYLMEFCKKKIRFDQFFNVEISTGNDDCSNRFEFEAEIDEYVQFWWVDDFVREIGHALSGYRRSRVLRMLLHRQLVLHLHGIRGHLLHGTGPIAHHHHLTRSRMARRRRTGIGHLPWRSILILLHSLHIWRTLDKQTNQAMEP